MPTFAVNALFVFKDGRTRQMVVQSGVTRFRLPTVPGWRNRLADHDSSAPLPVSYIEFTRTTQDEPHIFEEV